MAMLNNQMVNLIKISPDFWETLREPLANKTCPLHGVDGVIIAVAGTPNSMDGWDNHRIDQSALRPKPGTMVRYG
jgi:hypothetical protein